MEEVMSAQEAADRGLEAPVEAEQIPVSAPVVESLPVEDEAEAAG